MLKMFRRIPMALSAVALAVSTAYAFDPYLPNTSSLVHANTLTNTSYASDDVGNVVTMNGAVAFAPRDGKALWFAGTGTTAFSMPNGVFTPGTSFCMEAWIFPTAAQSGGWNFIFDTRNVVNAPTGIFLGHDASYNLKAGYAGTGIDITGGTLVPNKWQHIALVRNGSSLVIYLDGVAVASTNTFSRTLSDNHFLVGRAIDLTYGYTGIMDSMRVSSVPRYSGNFTPSTFVFDNTDSEWNNVVFAMNFTDGLVDIKNNAVTNSNTVVMIPGKYRNECIFLPGAASKYASIATNAGFGFSTTDDFTIELLMNLPALPTSGYIVPMACGTAGGFSMTVTPTGVTCGHSLQSIDHTYTVALQPNTWFHLAFVRKGGFMYCFKDGVLIGTPQPNATAYQQGAMILGVDGNTTSYPARYFLSELRITKGVSRYNLVTSASEFTSDADTLSLLHFNLDAGLVDSANPGQSWIFGGTAGLSTTQKLFGQSAMVNPTGGCKTSPTWTVGTGDYTLELSWYNTTASDSYVFDTSLNGNGNRAFLLNSGGGATMQYVESYGVAGGASITFNKPSLNAWHSFAAVRKNGITTIYIDGVSVGSQASTVWLQYTGITIGGYGNSFQYPFQAYYDEFRFSKVARYAGNYATTVLIPTATSANYNALDYYWDNVVFLTHLDSGTFSDVRGGTMTVVGGAVVSATQSRFGGNAADFTAGSNAAVRIAPLTIGTGDFTVEGWAFANASGTSRTLFSNSNSWTSNAGGNAWWLGTSSSTGGNDPTKLEFAYYGVETSSATGVLPLNQWYHWAISRKGGVVKCFVNGVQVISVTQAGNMSTPTGYSAVIGNLSTTNWYGYIDEVRITKGVGRYTANFPVNVDVFPTYLTGPEKDVYFNYNEVLLNFEGADNSNTFTNLVSGTSLSKSMNAVIKTDNFKTGASSGWFDGNSRVELDKVLNFGSSNFTMEAWVRPTSNVLYGSIITKRQSGIAAGFVLSVNSLVPKMYISSGTSTWDIASNVGTIAINLNTWNHLAVVRNGNTISLYVNGVLSGSVTSSAALVTSSITPCIGAAIDNTEAFIGYIDGVRVSKGVARYFDSFVPPNYAFPLTT